MSSSLGVIYIITNPSFPNYVKVGYTDGVEQFLKQLNRSECVPFAFQTYAVYEVSRKFTDAELCAVIDRLKPDVRYVLNFGGKSNKREFYNMSPEEAYSLLETIAMINGDTNKLELLAVEASDTGSYEEEYDEYGVALSRGENAGLGDCSVVNGRLKFNGPRSKRMKTFSFTLVSIPIGAELEYCRNGDKLSGTIVRVIDDKHVEYNGLSYTLSSLVSELSGISHPFQGTNYFKYKGEWLNEIRVRLGV